MKIQLLAWIGWLISVVLLVVGWIRYNTLGIELKVLFWYFVAAFFIDVTTLYLALNKMNNHLFYQIEGLLEYGAIALLLSFWQKNVRDRDIFRVSVATYAVFWTAAKLFLGTTTTFDNYSSSLSSFLIVLAASYTFVAVVKDDLAGLTQDVRFWVLSAILLVHATRILLQASINLMFKFPFEEIVSVMTLHWLAVTAGNFLFMRAFFCRQTVPTSTGL